MIQMKPFVLALLLVCCMFAGIGGYIFAHRSASASAPACVAGANEMCPNDKFTADYNIWLERTKLDAALTKNPDTPQRKIVDLEDQIAGQAARLQREFPAGYTFNETTRKFVSVVRPPAPPAAAPPPVPAKNP